MGDARLRALERRWRARPWLVWLGVALAWLVVVSIQANYTYGFVSAGLFVLALLGLGVLASISLLLFAWSSEARTARWGARAWAGLAFCLSAILTPGRITSAQEDQAQAQIVAAIEGYRAARGRYPSSLAELEDPALARAAVRIGWDLRPLSYRASGEGESFQIWFETPFFSRAIYDSREGEWTSD